MNYSNLTMLTDLYELTMMQGYFLTNTHEKEAVFDLFFRKNPLKNGYSIACGLELALDYIKSLKFTEEDIEYLKTLNIFREEFLQYLRDFKFTGEVYGVPEGTVVFPNEPLLRIKAPIIQGQLIESALLNIINHQSLIATKASRVVTAANGDTVLEFGLRRAQGPDASIYGSRAAIIGGCMATSNVIAGQMFDIPVSGTHAHSWIMSFSDEYEAFKAYSNIYRERCFLLVDTYNTLKSGLPNSIKIFKELKEENRLPKLYGIRLDSGDLAYLSIRAREMLDEAGFHDAIISASSDLDEYLIGDLKSQGAQITMWGVGTNLITSKDCPAFGGVYKISAEIDGDSITPKIKLSENPIKITNPGVKMIWRLYDKATKKMKADLITLDHEIIDDTKDLTIFDPNATWKKMTLKGGNFIATKILIPLIKDGVQIYEPPTTMEVKKYAKEQMDTLWSQHKRLNYPQIMPVDLSQELYDMKVNMINEMS